MSSDSAPSFPFAHPTLTKIDGQPTAANVRKLKREVYANAISVKTPLGGGNHGYLGLVMPAAQYNAMPGTNLFAVPVHPGAHPGHAAAATQAQITETNRAYLADKEAAEQCNEVHSAIKQQILASVDDAFIMTLQDDELGYANVTAQELLVHLTTTYGDITPDELDKNLKSLEEPWNPDTPIENLWKRVQDARRFATNGNDPISESTAVRLTLEVLEKSGVFGDAIRDWRKRAPAQWTLANLRNDFNSANKERVRQLTSRGAGYGANNNIDQANSTTTTTKTGLTVAHVLTNNGVKMYYCWSHGLGKNANHTSATCRNKADGHKNDSTADNMMGGNNTIMRGRRGSPNANANSETTTQE